MQKSIKKTTKLYLTMIMIGILVVALSLSLYFTLGTRSTRGEKENNSSGTVAQMSAQVVNQNDTKTDKATYAINSGIEPTGALYVKNTSNISAYVRAKVILTTGTTGGTTTDSNIYVTAGDGWTYAADNYLYYKDVVDPTEKTTAVFKSVVSTTASGTVSIQVVAEVIQKEAAMPNVAINGFEKVTTLGNGIHEQGLLNYEGTLDGLTDSEGENTPRTVTIENTGRLDLDVKVRIASSEWTISGAAITNKDVQPTDDDYTIKVERDANNGFFWVMQKLPAGKICTLKFIDSFKNNGILAGDTNVTLILQDYVLANDYYSIVNGSGQNIGSAFAGGTTKSVSGSSLSGAKIYSYNNVPQYIYVQTITDSKVDYASGWSIIEGEQIAISSKVEPKASTGVIYTTAPTGTVQIKVWSAIPIKSATVSLVSGGTTSTTDEPYGQVQVSNGTEINSLNSYNLAISNINATSIQDAWGNLRVKSSDYSDLIVRVAIGFEWGTKDTNSWTANSTQTPLAVDLTKYVGDGFAYNKEDSTLTYVYNLSNGNATPKLLNLDDATAGELVTAIKGALPTTGGQHIKLRVMIEAIYAEGSQFDVIYGGTKVGDTNDHYYISLNDYTSMVETGGMITYKVGTDSITKLNDYLVYVKNNFPLGIKVSLALQWGSVNESGVWEAESTTETTNPHSAINIYDYIDTKYWTFNADIGGAEYNYSVPGNAATKPLFNTDATGGKKTLTDLATALASDGDIDRNGQTVRLVVIVGTTHLG